MISIVQRLGIQEFHAKNFLISDDVDPDSNNQIELSQLSVSFIYRDMEGHYIDHTFHHESSRAKRDPTLFTHPVPDRIGFTSSSVCRTLEGKTTSPRVSINTQITSKHYGAYHPAFKAIEPHTSNDLFSPSLPVSTNPAGGS